MKQTILMVAALFLLAGITDQTQAQYKSKGVRLGAAGGVMSALTNAKANDIDFAARGFLRHNWTAYIDGDLAGTIGNVHGEKYQTDLYLGEYKLLFKFASGDWEPYGAIGAGVAYYYAHWYYRDPDVSKDGYVPYVPVALGFEYAMDDVWTLDFNAGFKYAFSGDMITTRWPDTGLENGNDAWWDAFLGISVALFGSDADADNDGLKKSEEEKLGTNAEKADTDGDGVSDGDEVKKYRTNPLQKDSDGDGLSDGDEVTHRTDPNKTDTDMDNVSDGAEVLKYKTDPLKPDTDGDALSDSDEITKYKSDPLKADGDGDGLSDADEALKHKTDPLKADTDGDKLNDPDELLQKTDPLKADTDADGLNDSDELQRKTDPLKADTDGDRLTDGEEVQNFRTDPLKVDTDGDGFNDGIEVLNSTNPLDPKSPAKEVPKPVEAPQAEALKAEVGKAIVLAGVTFKPGSAVVLPESEGILARALVTFLENPTIEVEIRGYTDNTGKASTNLRISQQRADAVKNWLVRRGVPASRIKTKGYGPADPVADNSTAEGRALNRRIEFIRTK